MQSDHKTFTFVSRIATTTLGAALSLGAVACSNDDAGTAAGEPYAACEPNCLLESTLTRDLTPAAPGADVAALATGQTAFAFTLYQQLIAEPDAANLFYSPFSVSQALAMTWAGAKGDTASQMADALHFTLAPEKLHPAMNALDLALASRGQGALAKDGQPFRLAVANALWGQEGKSFVESFLDTLALNYGAGMHVVDFIGATEPARVTINSWVEEKTEGRIKDLIPEGGVTQDTRLVLTNAIYFNAAWASQFDKEATADATFHRLDGTEVSVPTMHETEELPYVDGDGYVAVELAYDGADTAMTVIVPDLGTLATFDASLTGAVYESIVASLKTTNVALAVPKFGFTASFSLGKALKALGMTDAFDAADFSGMDGTTELRIADVIHKAFVAVDEEGTEAAAATAVIMENTSMPQEPVALKVDRPFLFVIRDVPTGTVLFVGRVVEPKL
jgi:serpin B